MIKNVALVTIYVRDEDEALRFYTEKLGFEVRADATAGPGMRWLTVSPVGQADLEIVLQKPGGWHDEETTKKLLDRIGQGTPWVFNTDDCQSTYETLQSRGVKFSSPPEGVPYGLQAIFEDPYGNPFVLLQPRMS